MEAAESKKAIDVLAMDMAQFLAITDYFVIASGATTIQVRAIAKEIEDRLREAGVKPLRREGLSGHRWILLDYGGTVVHVFHEEERDYYNLERYWQAAPRVKF
jgi:ribosome-associated protein